MWVEYGSALDWWQGRRRNDPGLVRESRINLGRERIREGEEESGNFECAMQRDNVGMSRNRLVDGHLERKRSQSPKRRKPNQTETYF